MTEPSATIRRFLFELETYLFVSPILFYSSIRRTAKILQFWKRKILSPWSFQRKLSLNRNCSSRVFRSPISRGSKEETFIAAGGALWSRVFVSCVHAFGFVISTVNTISRTMFRLEKETKEIHRRISHLTMSLNALRSLKLQIVLSRVYNCFIWEKFSSLLPLRVSVLSRDFGRSFLFSSGCF